MIIEAIYISKLKPALNTRDEYKGEGTHVTILLKFSSTKPTTFSRLFETKLLEFSQNLQSLSLSL